jgi:PAS domain-containing protein
MSLLYHLSTGRPGRGERRDVEVSERIRLQDRLAMLEAFVETSDDAIFSQDNNGRITSWNRGAQRIFGYLLVAATSGPSEASAIPDAARRSQARAHIWVSSSMRSSTTLPHRSVRKWAN